MAGLQTNPNPIGKPRDPVKRYGKPEYFDGTEPYCPQEWTPPLSPDAPSDGPRAIAFAKTRFRRETGEELELDSYQTKLICSMLELYPDDYEVEELRNKLRFKQAITSIPRRNGKSTIAAVLALYSMCLSAAPNMGVLASTKEQAAIVYNDVKYNFINDEVLKQRFKATIGKGLESRRTDKPAHFKIHAGVGDTLQGITFRGFIPVIVDELHITKAEAYDAAVKGASVGDMNGPIVGITTAGTEDSELLKRLYVQGRAAIRQDEDHNPRFGFWHWFVDSEAPLWDKQALLRANPAAYFGRIDLDQEILEGKANPAGDYSEYRRYRRNEFVSSEDLWLGLDVWAGGKSEGIPATYTGRLVFAVDRDTKWNWATITASCKIDNVLYTETVLRIQNPNYEWLTQECQHLYNTQSVEKFVANSNTLRPLIMNLRDDLHIPAEFLTEQQLANATALVASEVAKGRVKHNDSPVIKRQLPNTVTQVAIEGVKISTQKSPGSIDAVRSTVMGLYIADTMEETAIALYVF